MKVTKHGRKQTGWSKTFKCSGAGNGHGGCGAKLLVEQGDLFKTYRNAMGRDSQTFYTFRCSECGVLTDIEVPANIQDYVAKDEKEMLSRKGPAATTANDVFERWIGKAVKLVDKPPFSSDATPRVGKKGVVVGVLIMYMGDEVGAKSVLVDFYDKKPAMFCDTVHVQLLEETA